MLFVIIKCILLSLNPSYGAIPTLKSKGELTQKQQEVPFFKSKDSIFPSGSTTIDNLKNQIVISQNTTENFYKWNKIFFAETDLKPMLASHLSAYVIETKSNNRFKVIETTSKSILLYDEKTKQTKKTDLSEVHADPYDHGFVITLKDTYLKKLSQNNSVVLTTIPQGVRLAPQKFEDQYVLVQYQNYSGYIDISEVVTKFDFASFIFAKNSWQRVKKREFNKIITDKNVSISLNEIKGVLTHNNRGIIVSSNQKIPIWSQVEIIKNKNLAWHQSKLKDQGLVWWRTQKTAEQIYYNIDQLLEKEISSVSFNPKNPLKAIISADGVYLTNDGENWKKLDQFENYNGPVHYFNENLLFVGNFKSSDGGQTFENYIQIDKLASAIEKQYGFIPKKLQVKKIASKSPYKLTIEIQTGSRSIKMESPLFAQDWRASRL